MARRACAMHRFAAPLPDRWPHLRFHSLRCLFPPAAHGREAGGSPMRRPGDRLHALAARLFDPSTMERLIDPVIADLQRERADALSRGQVWRGRWIYIAS